MATTSAPFAAVVRDARTGRVLLNGYLDPWAPRGVRGWIERELDVHQQGYSLSQADDNGEYVVRFKRSLAAVFGSRGGPDGLPRDVPLTTMKTQCRRRIASLEIEELWTEFGIALVGAGQRYLKLLRTMHVSCASMAESSEDSRDHCEALGVLKFVGTTAMNTGEKVVLSLTIEMLSSDNILVGARLDLHPDPSAPSPVAFIPFAAVWTDSKTASPEIDEMDICVASTTSPEEAKVLAWLVACKSPIDGTLSFQGSESGCLWRTSSAPISEEAVALHFVAAQDMRFWR